LFQGRKRKDLNVAESWGARTRKKTMGTYSFWKDFRKGGWELATHFGRNYMGPLKGVWSSERAARESGLQPFRSKEEKD